MKLFWHDLFLMKLESSATFLSRFLVGDGLFAKPRKIKCTVHMEVLFKDSLRASKLSESKWKHLKELHAHLD